MIDLLLLYSNKNVVKYIYINYSLTASNTHINIYSKR